MKDNTKDNILVCLIVILVSVFILSVIYSDKETNRQLCNTYNFTKHFDMVKSFTLMSDLKIKSIHILNETNITTQCYAETRMCIEGLRMCFDGILYSQPINKTY